MIRLKRLFLLLAALTFSTPLVHSQKLGVSLSVNRGGLLAAYTSLEHGVDGNPTAPLATRGDHDPSDTTSIAGAYDKFPRQAFVANTPCANGDLLVWYQGMDTNADDYGVHGIRQIRSTDKGRTWGAPTTVFRLTASTSPVFTKSVNFLFTGSAVVDSTTGYIHLVYTQTEGATGGTAPSAAAIKIFHTCSTDHGVTWAVPDDITSQAKKTASNTTAPWDGSANPWGWCIVGPGAGVQIQNGASAGRMMFSGGHRYTMDNTGTSYAHVLYTDDHTTTPTWSLAGPLESTSTGVIEPAIVEFGTGGEVYLQARQASGNYRKAVKSTGGSGTIWGNAFVAQDGTGGTTALTSIATQGSLCRTADGTLYALFPSDTGVRNDGKLWKSTNDGDTWTVSRTLYSGRFGYSGLQAVDGSSLLAVYEYSTNSYDQNDYNVAWYQDIGISRVPTSYVTATPSVPSYSHWTFNEKSSGTCAPFGNSVIDRGTQRCHARATVAGVAIAGGTHTSTGIQTSGAALALILCEKVASAVNANAADIGASDYTWEMPDFVMSSSASSRIIQDSRNNSNAAVGYTVAATLTHKFFVAISDGTNVATVTGNATIDDGNPHDLAWTWNATTKVLTTYVDGVQDGTATQASMAANLVSTYGHALGGKWNNTTAGAGTYAAFTCDAIRLTHGIRSSSDLLTGDETKQTLDEFYGYTAPTVAVTKPTDISGLQMWLFATSDDCRQAGADTYGGWTKRTFPPNNGTGFASYIEPVSGKFFTLTGVLSNSKYNPNRGMWVNTSTAVGKFYRMSYQASATGFAWCPTSVAGTTWDFMHNAGGAFTVTCALCFNSGGTGVIFSNTDNVISNDGLYIQRTNTTGFDVRVSQGGVNLSSSSYTRTCSNGTWYFFAYVFPGGTTRPYIYTAAYTTAPAYPSIGTAVTAGADAVAASGTVASDLAPTIGAKTTDTTGSDLSIKNFCIWNRALNSTELGQMSQFNSAY